ncbi:Aste57867_4499 [Aphanomyces stellatus]|uniref:Aste57867_4499 protein n=1 Tax=Aphanomyces stellatus TaxID=120398 RepID=A0A485KFZ7_9STRA|nr:hypothetical protein As57867_004486 [Aphanomyces stellatus]VFT81609.1 Aste57867_4499 [Aphanomyces stellatus]
MSEMKSPTQFDKTSYGSFQDASNPTFVGDDDDDDENEDEGADEDYKKDMIQLFQEGKFSAIVSRLEAGNLKEEDYSSDYGGSILAQAAELGKDDIVQLILRRASYKKCYDYAYDPIFKAAKKNRRKIVEILLKSIKEIDLTQTRNLEGMMPLHIAAMNGSNEICELLIAAGAPVDAFDEQGLSPLHHAAQNGHRRVAEILLAAGANIDLQTEHEGSTPLHLAVANEEWYVDTRPVVELLLRNDAALDIHDNEEQSIVDVAIKEELGELVTSEEEFRNDYPVHRMARDGKLADLEAWIAETSAAGGGTSEEDSNGQLEWKGQFQQGGEWSDTAFKSKILRVNGTYRFIGQDKDGEGGFSVNGTWTGNHLEMRKEYEDGYAIMYDGEFDEATGEWSGKWECPPSSDLFRIKVPVFECPTCGKNQSGIENEDCLTCGGPGEDLTDEEIDEMRFALVEAKEGVKTMINSQDTHGCTVVMHATLQYRLDVLKVVLKYVEKSDLDITDENGENALALALGLKVVCAKNTENRSNDELVEIIQLLARESGDKINPENISGELDTEVEGEMCCGDCQLADKKNGLDVAKMADDKQWATLTQLFESTLASDVINAKDASEMTALHRICEHGNADILKLILKQEHLELYPQNSDGEYPLLVAIRNKRIKCIRILLKAGCPPLKLRDEETDELNNFRPILLLNSAIKADRVVLERYYLQEKYPLYYMANVESIQEAEEHIGSKRTPLHAALLSKEPLRVVTNLVECNIDVDAKDNRGRTALMIASENGDADIVSYLLEQEPMVDTIDENGESALFYAAVPGHVKVVEVLLEALADLDIENTNGCSVQDVVKAENTKANAREDSIVSSHEVIRNMLVKEEESRESSLEYRNKLSKSLVGMEPNVAFEQNGFSKAINCDPELARTFLDDCVNMTRHDVGFSALTSVYGKTARNSVLYGILNLKGDDDELQTKANEECLDHVVMSRIMAIKWELFGQQKYLEQLVMNILLLFSLTISSLMAGHPPSGITFPMILGVFSTVLAVVGFLTVQFLQPKMLWRLARFMYEGSMVFSPYLYIPHLKQHKQKAKTRLAQIALILTVLLTGLILSLIAMFGLEKSFPFVINVVLGVTALYFLWNETKELITGGVSEYVESSINLAQTATYLTIFFVIVPAALGIFIIPPKIMVGISGVATIVLWILSVQFLEVVPSASYMLPMMGNMLKDVKNFFIFFGVFQIGLTVSFYQLFGGNDDPAFDTFVHSFVTTYFVAFGNLPTDSLGSITGPYEDFQYYVGVGMIMFQAAVVVILLLNVLLAMMNKTVDGGLEAAITEALAKYANCIMRLELSLNMNEQKNKELIYFVLPGTDPTEPNGRLNPIFEERVFKTELNMTDEKDEKLRAHETKKANWAALINKIDADTTAEIDTLENKLKHVAHFTSLQVDEVFSNEFSQIHASRDQLKVIFIKAHKAKGQDREHVLNRLRMSLLKETNKLEQDILRVWIANKDELHKKCVLLFHLAYHNDVQHFTDKMKTQTLELFDAAVKEAKSTTLVEQPLLSDLEQQIEGVETTFDEKIQKSKDHLEEVVKTIKDEIVEAQNELIEEMQGKIDSMETKMDELMDLIRELKQ